MAVKTATREPSGCPPMPGHEYQGGAAGRHYCSCGHSWRAVTSAVNQRQWNAHTRRMRGAAAAMARAQGRAQALGLLRA